ncbi:hypothetical protein, conserved [Trypanosoma brucei brucei TREU927]|uniref:Uncharacterized protein n=1 Tax=Trypanosoma brucei brucei (strain 927/4 GUTat10.1) TaxID=185431 RepID=Q38FC6_TRYB2|nr:hypothetical protein, conserved [Trypanosoma brucei brucei TREU927]EAN76494.1 hypothetical protein, conserved [Trypanosoma brucei brucei TREU927]
MSLYCNCGRKILKKKERKRRRKKKERKRRGLCDAGSLKATEGTRALRLRGVATHITLFEPKRKNKIKDKIKEKKRKKKVYRFTYFCFFFLFFYFGLVVIDMFRFTLLLFPRTSFLFCFFVFFFHSLHSLPSLPSSFGFISVFVFFSPFPTHAVVISPLFFFIYFIFFLCICATSAVFVRTYRFQLIFCPLLFFSFSFFLFCYTVVSFFFLFFVYFAVLFCVLCFVFYIFMFLCCEAYDSRGRPNAKKKKN